MINNQTLSQEPLDHCIHFIACSMLIPNMNTRINNSDILNIFLPFLEKNKCVVCTRHFEWKETGNSRNIMSQFGALIGILFAFLLNHLQDKGAYFVWSRW